MQVFTYPRSRQSIAMPTANLLTGKRDRPRRSIVARWVRGEDNRLYCEWVRQ